MIVWQAATNEYVSPFINNLEVPLRTPPPFWNVPQPLLVNEKIIKDLTTLLIGESPLNECFKLPPIVQISVRKSQHYAKIVRKPLALQKLIGIELVNVKENSNVFFISQGSQTGDYCSDVLPDTVEFEFMDSII